VATCAECKSFFSVPEDADDFEPGKGDCVVEVKDEKGKYWLSKLTMSDKACNDFKAKVGS
jgi:benzylsuccinate synthase